MNKLLEFLPKYKSMDLKKIDLIKKQIGLNIFITDPDWKIRLETVKYATNKDMLIKLSKDEHKKVSNLAIKKLNGMQ